MIAECPLASSYLVSIIWRKRKRLKPFFPFSSKMGTMSVERASSLQASRRIREVIWGKAHSFAWIFPGCTELPFCGPDAPGLRSHLLVPKQLAVRRRTFASLPSAFPDGIFFGNPQGKEVLMYKAVPSSKIKILNQRVSAASSGIKRIYRKWNGETKHARCRFESYICPHGSVNVQRAQTYKLTDQQTFILK